MANMLLAIYPLERIPMKLTGRTILITGGSAGIGLAFALKFLELGNQVIVTGRRESALNELKAKYPKLHTIQSDVADPAQIVVLFLDCHLLQERLGLRRASLLNGVF